MRDEQTKRERGYKDKRSKVRPDGSEVLYGKDWTKRKLELWERCEGRCEQPIYIPQQPPEYCRNEAHDPHHIVPRSKGRDDRLSNLQALCRMHHDLLDWKKLKHIRSLDAATL